MVCWPDKNRGKESTTLCGKIVPKVTRDGYSWLHQDLDKVTATLDKVDCVKCLKLRVKQLNETIYKTIDKIEGLK